jgi:uncharacterized alpha-E superfamily protein
MLLSRVADSLYWVGRYLERAEHTVRLVDVAVDHGLDRAGKDEDVTIGRLYRAIGLTTTDVDPAALVETALFDPANRSSMAACVMAARENARQVREEVSSDMWVHLNELFLRVKQVRSEEWSGRTHYLARSVIDGIHLFQGVTDSTMGHGEGWQYLRIGRFLERAGATAVLLDLFVTDTAAPSNAPVVLDQVEWVALLRSCSALEAYCRHYTAAVSPERVAEFLLLNPEFPRSTRFAAARLEDALRAVASYSGRDVGSRTDRLAGRLRALLDYGQVDEILGDSPHAYLRSISRQCTQIHAALSQSYIAYSVESALGA